MERQDLINELVTFILNNSNDFWGTFSDDEIISLYGKTLDLKSTSLQAQIDVVVTAQTAITNKTIIKPVQADPVQQINMGG